MTISEFNNTYKSLSKDVVKTFLQEHNQEDLPSSTLGRAFERLYIDSKTGHTEDNISLSELCALHHSFSLGNGGGWSRRDNGSFLGRLYEIVNHKTAGRITAISSNGFKQADSFPSTKRIPISVLFELEDAVDAYEGLSAALSDRNSVPDEIYDDVVATRDAALYKMYQIAKQLTTELPADNR